ncbi:serine/threonine-protein kinase [Nocardioides ginsengisegetis]|uniref:non-specific serine/threonine protein kinase n=1 Tax=Nocardioides ginsengisegetis TaxID=661491 RepID=A0A7W3IYM5_9ACTN|nr:serine/threonine-protein kinase [Nocardioides ginsengisegetis]MBA8802969.1 serine/threonine-protein kinase [Nocardioides ginsengisegetis]
MSEMYGPYEVLQRVAEGSTSTVYRARHVALDRPAAIKVLSEAISRSPEMRERLRAEAEILAGLESPHVVEVYDFVEEDDRAWLAEEWVDGASLDRILEQHGTLTPEQSVGVIREAVLGLAFAHDRGLLHRDVSPRNILADLQGTSKLVDFGLAAPTGEAGFVGTPAFMSPEAGVGGSLSRASDVYSTAAVLYTLLAGHPPYAGSDLATTVRRHVEEEVPLLDGHGADLQDLLRRSMAKDPAQRPQDARAFLAELEEAARRRFGPAWLQRASIAALVAGVTPLAAAGLGSTAAPTVLVDTASIVSSQAVKAAKSGTKRLALIGGVVGAVVVATVATVAAKTGGGPDHTATPPAASDSPSAQPVDDPSPTPKTLEELTPSGKYDFTRVLLSSTYDQKLPKKEHRVWTLDLKKCKHQSCAGVIHSSSGSVFRYTYDGKHFVVIPPKGGKSVFEGVCQDTQTGQDVPGTKGRDTTTIVWSPLRVVRKDADGLPVRLEGTQRLTDVYEGLIDCDDSPSDHARYREYIVRR